MNKVHQGSMANAHESFAISAQQTLTCAVNYIWINKANYTPAAGEPPCGVPLDNIDQVIENARRYPKAEFQVWLDPKLLESSSTMEILYAHLDKAGCNNLKLRDLNDLPEYQNSPFYRPDFGIPVWHRVDMARLLVTREEIEANPNKVVVYADFDTKDVGIESKKFKESIAKYGFVIGATTGPQQEFNLENGYFAFRPGSKAVTLLDKIKTNTYEQTSQGVENDRDDVFRSYRDTVQAYAEENKIRPLTRCLTNVLEPCTYVMPRNPEYNGLSL